MSSRSQYVKFFEEEVQTHYEYILKFLLTITKDGPLAWDIAQETMATAWEKVHIIEQYSDVKHALRRIARNKLYDYYDKGKSYKALMKRLEKVKMVLTEEDGLLHLIKDEERRTLLTAIGELTMENMQVILLHYFYGQSFRDVAKMTETNYNTVVSRHRRALKTLEGLLEERKQNKLRG
jgi:RNA polymerase sigma-70 factor (ECF subfamily)